MCHRELGWSFCKFLTQENCEDSGQKDPVFDLQSYVGSMYQSFRILAWCLWVSVILQDPSQDPTISDPYLIFSSLCTTPHCWACRLFQISYSLKFAFSVISFEIHNLNFYPISCCDNPPSGDGQLLVDSFTEWVYLSHRIFLKEIILIYCNFILLHRAAALVSMSHDTEIESIVRVWPISVFSFLCGFEEHQTAPLQGTVTVLITHTC